MGLASRAFVPAPRASTFPPPATSDFWYTRDPSGYIAETGGTGLALTADTIMKCGTVLAAVRFRGDSWAVCPPSTFVKTARGRVEDAAHYSQRVLRNPNRWQTGNRWRHLNGVWMSTWGNAYNEIRAGRTSFADELWPLHPSVTKVVDQRADGSLLYLHQAPGQPEKRLGQEHVLHFREISTDGMRGLEMYRLIRNTVGIALLAEQHASTFLRKGTRISGLLVPSSPLNKENREALRDSVNEAFGSPNSSGTLGVLPHGIDLKQLQFSHKEAQFLELSDQAVGAILRFLGVPGVIVGWADKTATYASAEAFFEKGGIKHCVLPILANCEAEEEKALLLEGDGRQIKHNLDVLQRASYKDRIEGLARSVGGPFMAVNEARRIEDMNPLDDARYDEVLTPSNMAGGSEPEEPAAMEPPEPPARRKPPMDDAEEQERGHASPPLATQRWPADSQSKLAQAYASDNATRVVRREIATITAKAPRFARDANGWRAFVLETYGKHAAHVSEVMRIPESEARAYCDQQVAKLLAQGAGAVETMESEAVPRLVALALGKEMEAA